MNNDNRETGDLNKQDLEYLKNEKLRIRQQEQFQKARKKIERTKAKRKKRQQRSKYFQEKIQYFSAFFKMESIVAFFALYLTALQSRNHTLKQLLEGQQIQTAYIQKLESENKGSIFKELLSNPETVTKILVCGGTILVPLVRKMGNQSQEIRKRDSQLLEIKKESLEFQEKARLELETVKIEKDEKIAKLHVTLNRLNESVLKSTEKETEMRAKILTCEQELANAIQSRDLMEIRLKDSEELLEIKNEQLSNYAVQLKQSQEKIKIKETEQAKLKTDLEIANSQKSFFSLKAGGLEKKIRKVETERKNISTKISQQEKQISDLKMDKNSLSKDLSSQLKTQTRLRQKAEKLKIAKTDTSSSLKSVVNKTTNYALEMDETKKEIELIENDNLIASKETQQLRNQKHQQQEKIENKEKQIRGAAKQNKELEKTFHDSKRQLDQVIIDTDQIKHELAENKQTLKETENRLNKENKNKTIRVNRQLEKERQKLNKKIIDQNKTLNSLAKKEKSLHSTCQKQESDLKNNLHKQEGFIKDLRKMKIDSNQYPKSFLRTLIQEREHQEAKFNYDTANKLTNDLLDQQELDQSKSWLQKIKFNFSPKIQIGTRKVEEKKNPVIEKESFFYPQSETSIMKVKEIFNPDTNKWEITEPKR